MRNKNSYNVFYLLQLSKISYTRMIKLGSFLQTSDRESKDVFKIQVLLVNLRENYHYKFVIV